MGAQLGVEGLGRGGTEAIGWRGIRVGGWSDPGGVCCYRALVGDAVGGGFPVAAGDDQHDGAAFFAAPQPDGDGLGGAVAAGGDGVATGSADDEPRVWWLPAGGFDGQLELAGVRVDLDRQVVDREATPGTLKQIKPRKKRRTTSSQRLEAGDFVPLVAALGAALRRDGLTERAYWSMTDLIGTLGDDPSAAATETIEELSRESNAEPWKPAIAGEKERQARKRREHEYRHSDIGKVAQTLDRGTPANAGDLAALVFEELTALSLKIRDGSTSDWRQYWNVDHHNRPTNPKPEDACRDAVLSDLQERLGRLGIDAQPEGVYAEDKRSDIRISFGGFMFLWRSSEAATLTSGQQSEVN